MMDRQPGEQLDYNQLLLKHLDRISFLSAQISGLQTTSQGSIHYREEDKQTAFIWAIKVLDEIIPKSIKDKKSEEDHEENQKKHIKTKKNKDGEEYTTPSINFWFSSLHKNINLLARKGLLLETKGIGKYLKKKKPEEEKEVWEK